MPSARFVSLAIGMLLKLDWPFGVTAVSEKVALAAGSSHIGANRRASAGSNWVTTIRLGALPS